MTNNYSIKPNLVQIEEVRELKSEIPSIVRDQIPSWEEFSKNYQGDKNIEASYIAECEEWARMNGYGPGWGEWTSKLVITTAAGIVLGPAAIPVGAVVWGASAGLEKLAESQGDEDARKVFSYISDCGKDTFTGGMVGGAIGLAAQGTGAAMGFNKVAGLGKNISGSIASARHGIKVGSQVGAAIDLLKDLGFAAKDIKKHLEHVENGYEYRSDCEICKA